MKKTFLLTLSFAAAALLVSCGGRGHSGKTPEPAADSVAVAEASAEAEAESPADAGTDLPGFTFDELWKIFSVFGPNIAPDIVGTQAKKEAKKDQMQENYNGSMSDNILTVGEYDINGCGTDYTMGCYRYKADGHVLVILIETTGCDVNSQDVRAYEYDPEQNNAHEIDLPVERDKQCYNDYLRLYRCKDAARFYGAQRDIWRYDLLQDGIRILYDVEEDYGGEDWWKTERLLVRKSGAAALPGVGSRPFRLPVPGRPASGR